MAIGIHIRLAQRVFVAESKEGTQAQSHAIALQKGVTDEEARARVTPQKLLLNQHSAHTIGNGGGGSVLEVDNIFVTSGLVVVREAVDSKVEGLLLVHNGLIERREQHILLILLIDGANNQTVVLTSVAAHDGSAHITTRSVGRKHLSLERILQIAQTVFIKCQRHLVYLLPNFW